MKVEHLWRIELSTQEEWKGLPCVEIYVMDCDIEVNEFEFQSRYFPFQQIPLGKLWTPYSTSYGVNSDTTV